MQNREHPGLFIRSQVIEPLGLTVTEAARVLGVGRPALSALLNGSAKLTPQIAFRIEKAFGLDMEHLLQRQCVYDVIQARKEADRIRVERYQAA
ncbi:MAG: HigA family addiction module antitoxin [Gammaproteobacteria bacterium]